MSEIRANTVSNAAGTGPVTLTGQSAAKAWAWVDQYLDNVIDQSNNVSSFTDEGTGVGRVSVSNAFANSQPVTNITTYRSTIESGMGNSGASTYNASDLRTVTRNNAGTTNDTEFGIVAHGDLA